MQAKQKGAEWLAEAALHGVMAAIMLPYTAWKVVGLVSSQWGLVLNRSACFFVYISRDMLLPSHARELHAVPQLEQPMLLPCTAWLVDSLAHRCSSHDKIGADGAGPAGLLEQESCWRMC